jgi:predicted ribosome quality control (RQC) complex YloA/Tae2 family protein
VHQNYYFLKQVSAALSERLQSAVISECFSQAREEILIRFETYTKPFFIRASLLSEFSTISFPDDFQRARKNSIDLFPLLIGQRVQSITQFTNERSFAINLTNDLQLVFKMHGNRSNLLLFEREAVIAVFKRNIKGDYAIKPSELNRHIDWTFDAFQNHRQNLKQLYFTFGKHVWQDLEESGFYEKDIDEQWQQIQHVLSQLNDGKYFVVTGNGKPVLTLIKPKAQLTFKKFDHPFDAANEFYFAYTQVYVFEKEKADAISKLKSNLGSSYNYIGKGTQKLKEISEEDHYKVWADLIMANLHQIPAGADSVTVENFYDNNSTIQIRLKQELSPQKNAEIFYRKAKNQQIEIDHLRKAVAEKEKRIDTIKQLINQVEESKDLRTLRAIVNSNILLNAEEKDTQALPYHEFDFKGFRILVGKNAQSNDILTQQLSYKEDLWLHAKDVAGSHVLIKYQSGKTFPKDVIERAAQLAAYNSKRKNDSLCPVIVTPKKYVRKRKGDVAGMVVVEREEVILVEPKL